ncbi:class I SAM-dependent methyltransferase [Lamprobacter modestohalophilus]|uniref:class I SAM-dependent methyltransferase n=1 Tax=Lamprobacter modestohalophilus TaxID=1064514 RepID=UPI002ADED12D|nr:class I SAM-dependent methyltransferase [Lamprobacter modestohalophilus]MEA1051627.1 class I SAM-dependent methyltransferase [Lamprobacter modestohalophilus]
MNCRHCNAPLELPLIDLGSAPPSNAYLSTEDLRAPETWYPLRVLVCTHCWLVQTQDFARADELFSADYAYFSSVSRSWLAHAERYVADMTERFALNATSHVVEIAANDGYLLQYVQARGIPCTGIEPTRSTADAARAKGIPIVEDFFGVHLADQLAADGRQADLMAANNVLAHVPDINDFVSGFARLLKPQGVATFEFPHLLRLIQEAQFDTIYHEHFSYLSLLAVERICAANGLAVFDVERLPTHGGSLRVFAQRADQLRQPHAQPRQPQVDALLAEERAAGLERAEGYAGLQARADQIKNDLLSWLIEQQRAGRRIAGYGAAAKGNTLLNYAGVRPDLLPFVCDAAPSKQGHYLPGSRIPIRPPSALEEEPPEAILILPWNIADEVKAQLAHLAQRGTRFVTAVPELRIHSQGDR